MSLEPELRRDRAPCPTCGRPAERITFARVRPSFLEPEHAIECPACDSRRTGATFVKGWGSEPLASLSPELSSALRRARLLVAWLTTQAADITDATAGVRGAAAAADTVDRLLMASFGSRDEKTLATLLVAEVMNDTSRRGMTREDAEAIAPVALERLAQLLPQSKFTSNRLPLLADTLYEWRRGGGAPRVECLQLLLREADVFDWKVPALRKAVSRRRGSRKPTEGRRGRGFSR